MKKGLSVVAAALMLLGLCGCNDKKQNNRQIYFQDFPQYSEYVSSKSTAIKLYGYAMCADVDFVTADKDNFNSNDKFSSVKTVWSDVCETISTANASLSVSVDSSPVSAFNRAPAGAEIKLDKISYGVLSLAKSIYDLTDGYYNPAVYHCADLYGFTPSSSHAPEKDGLPDEDSVAAFKELAASFGELGLYEREGAYYAKKPVAKAFIGGVEYAMKLDLGGIGKGWCADEIADLMSDGGIDYGYFSFGSSSMAIAKFLTSAGGDGEYTVGAKDPRGRGAAFSLKLADTRLSTSADNEQFFELDGVRYCHIIDPTTGSPVQTGIASATVIGGSAAEDDAITTALMAMGKDRAVEFIREHLSDRKVCLIVSEGGEWKLVTNCADDIVQVNQNYTIESIL